MNSVLSFFVIRLLKKYIIKKYARTTMRLNRRTEAHNVILRRAPRMRTSGRWVRRQSWTAVAEAHNAIGALGYCLRCICNGCEVWTGELLLCAPLDPRREAHKRSRLKMSTGFSSSSCRFADYLVICGLDTESGLEPDELSGKTRTYT